MTATDQKQITVLLVEDHEVTRVGLHSLLGSFEQISIVGEAATEEEAIARARELKPDVILMDIRLRNGSGFRACQTIRKMGLDSRVLFLTSFADDEVLFQALASGADGYLLKEINSANLVSAIETVAAGNSILDPVVTRRVMAKAQSAQPIASPEAELLNKLSPQELRIVALVADGKTNKEIAAVLGLSEKTVKNYLSNAMEKLNTSRRSHAAALFIQSGKRVPDTD
jgi:two-component system, NarL family, response regulator DevR